MDTGQQRSYSVGEVFVPGGLPTVTYDARSELQLEQRVRDYLDERHRILSVSGPTKSGKTVLLRSLIEDPVWLAGGEIRTADEFWSTIVDRLGVETEAATGDSITDSRTDSRSAGGALFAHAEAGSTDSTSNEKSFASSRRRDIPAAAREELIASGRVLVVDDFHYIPQDVQLAIVRGLKDSVFNGLPVVFASVPHRAYDAVRVEKEMTGRVEQMAVAFWSNEELVRIAERGFVALNAVDADGSLADRLSQESFASPHLMQDFCLQLCKANDARTTSFEPQPLEEPNWDVFFRERGSAASKSAFDLLARGPRQRADRKQRDLIAGGSADIYGVVLAAIAKTGPLTELTYEQVRSGLRDVLDEESPQRHEVTRVLEEMAKISRDQIDGEPVLDYDAEMSTLHIADPFFAYFLRWGREELG